jgi:protein-L-isoaspartate O-methyltransferase
MRGALMRWKFLDYPEEYLLSAQFQSDITEEIYRRVDRFGSCLVPWVRRVHPPAGARVIEVGSGTGSSTLAFAPHVGQVHCFEIEPKTTAIAKERLRFWGVHNVTFEECLFD